MDEVSCALQLIFALRNLEALFRSPPSGIMGWDEEDDDWAMGAEAFVGEDPGMACPWGMEEEECFSGPPR